MSAPLKYIRAVLLPGETFTSSKQKAFYISNLMWNLSQPVSGQNNEDTLFAYVENATETEAALEFESNFPFYVHPTASQNAFDSFLQPYINAGLAPASILAEVQNKVISARGTRVDYLSSLPAAFQSMLKTQEELKAFGYFPAPMMPGTGGIVGGVVDAVTPIIKPIINL